MAHLIPSPVRHPALRNPKALAQMQRELTHADPGLETSVVEAVERQAQPRRRIGIGPGGHIQRVGEEP